MVLRILECDKLFAAAAARSMLALELNAEIRPDDEAATARPLMVISCRSDDEIVVVEVRFPDRAKTSKRVLELKGTAPQGRARYVALTVAEFVHEIEASPPDPKKIARPRRVRRAPPSTPPPSEPPVWFASLGAAAFDGQPGSLGWGLDLELQHRLLPWLSWSVGVRFARQQRASAPGDLVGQHLNGSIKIGVGGQIASGLYADLHLGTRLGALMMEGRPDGGSATFGWGGPSLQTKLGWLALDNLGVHLSAELGTLTWGGEARVAQETIDINGLWWSAGGGILLAF